MDEDETTRAERTIATWSAAGLGVCVLSFGLFAIARARDPEQYPVVAPLNIATAVLMVCCAYMLVSARKRSK